MERNVDDAASIYEFVFSFETCPAGRLSSGIYSHLSRSLGLMSGAHPSAFFARTSLPLSVRLSVLSQERERATGKNGSPRKAASRAPVQYGTYS